MTIWGSSKSIMESRVIRIIRVLRGIRVIRDIRDIRDKGQYDERRTMHECMP